MNLLFQVDSDDFGEDITLKPYLKYKYQEFSKGPKKEGKEAFLKAINGSNIDHIFGLNLLKKKGYCYFCLKKSILQP